MNMKKCDLCGSIYRADVGVELKANGTLPRGTRCVPVLKWDTEYWPAQYRVTSVTPCEINMDVDTKIDVCPECFERLLSQIYEIQEVKRIDIGIGLNRRVNNESKSV